MYITPLRILLFSLPNAMLEVHTFILTYLYVYHESIPLTLIYDTLILSYKF